jgi:hypothetical protein
MATIRKFINRLLGRSEAHEAACKREEDAAKKLQQASVTVIHRRAPPAPLRRRVV